jgi:alkylation response protein AidB-like acyl-CoA dehydrogenase
MTATVGLDRDTLDMMLDSLDEFVTAALADQRRLELDREDICPEETIRAMCGEDLGVHLVFIPEEYGGLGGGAFDSYRVCERLARVDIGVATAVFATFLGSDPILVGATPEQRKEWLGRIAEQGILFAYAATEPEAGSDLAALSTTATPAETDGQVTAYRLGRRSRGRAARRSWRHPTLVSASRQPARKSCVLADAWPVICDISRSPWQNTGTCNSTPLRRVQSGQVVERGRSSASSNWQPTAPTCTRGWLITASIAAA